MKRRIFLKTSSILSGGVALGLKARASDLAAATSLLRGATKSRVVIAHQNDVRDAHQKLSSAKVSRLLDKTMEALFQVPSETAWRSLFSPNDIVGLKVNCLAGKNLSTHPQLVDEIIDRLARAGIKKQNIIIFDRRNRDLLRAGYAISQKRGEVQCIGNDAAGFSDQIFEFGAVGSQISNVVYRYCTAIINLPILKDHGIVGLSCAMKNFFGVINNPNKYHMDVGDPFVADVNMLPPIRKKHRLTICDALTAQYEGGPPFMPQWAWPMNSFMAATDMVAMDRVAWDIIEDKRRAHGIDALEKVGRKPSYIATAADPTHALGTHDPDKIEVVRA